MERARSFPSRRRLLKGAALAALPYALLPDARAAAQTAAVDYPGAEWTPATSSNYTASDRPDSYGLDYVVIHVTQATYADTLSIFQEPAEAGVRALRRPLRRRACGPVRPGTRRRLARGELGLQHQKHRHRARGLGRQAGLLHQRALRGVGAADRGDLRPSTASPRTAPTSSATTRYRAPTTPTRARTGTGRATSGSSTSPEARRASVSPGSTTPLGPSNAERHTPCPVPHGE